MRADAESLDTLRLGQSVPAMVRLLDGGRKSRTLGYDPRCPVSLYQTLVCTAGQGQPNGSSAADAAEPRKPRGDFFRVADLVAWADAYGRCLDPEAFELSCCCATGGEHVVLYDEPSGRVVKLTKPGFVGYYAEDAGAYLLRWALANRAFGDDVALEGIVRLPQEEAPRVVISQPFALGRDAAAPELAEFLRRHGYVEHDGIRWIHPVLGITVGDTLTAGNAIAAEDGAVIPIDLLLDFTPVQDLRAARERSGQGSSSVF